MSSVHTICTSTPLSTPRSRPTLNVTGRVTRSMAKKKFLVLDENIHSSSRQTRTAASLKAKSRPMSVLGQKTTNVQQDRSIDGLKRKDPSAPDEEGMRKRIKSTSVRPNGLQVTRPDAASPRTPEKRTETLAQPTPARVLLSARPARDANEDEKNEDESMEFVARPPTPPRRHIDQYFHPVTATPRQAPVPQDNNTITRTMATSTPQVTSSATQSLAPPTTPKMIPPTPSRVMSSISRFRAGPSTESRPKMTPCRSPGVRKPILADILANPTTISTAREQPKEQTGYRTIPPAPETSEDVDMEVGDDIAPANVNSLQSSSLGLSGEIPKSDLASSVSSPCALEARSDTTPMKQQALDAPKMSMPPPSRIPRATMAPLPRPTPISAPATQPAPSALPGPTSKQSALAALGRGAPFGPGDNHSAPRKPSYPSALSASGAGPRPRDRLISGPTLYPQKDRSLGPQKELPAAPVPKPSSRSISEPATRPRASLSASTSRREGMSTETSKSLAGLSDALSKLKSKRPESASAPTRSQPHSNGSSSLSMSAPSGPPSVKVTVPTITLSQGSSNLSRVSSVHRPRQSLALRSHAGDESVDGEHAGDRTLADLVNSTSGTKCLKGVVAFVDVRTADGDDASPIFADMLRSLGARVSVCLCPFAES